MECFSRPILFITPYRLLETAFTGPAKCFMQNVAKTVLNWCFIKFNEEIVEFLL